MWFLKHGLVFFSSIQNSLLCLSLIATAASTDVPKKNPFSWKAGTWGECISSECGSAGLQVRPVWCVHSEGWSTHQSNCHLWKRPALQRTCAKVCEWQRQLFEWQPSAWGPCSPAPPLASEQCVTAQRGLQRRTATCVLRSNGTDVSSHMCQAFSPTPELERACLLPCPLDCVVSTFSHWSPCSRTCAPALQHRTRQVLAPPLYGGDACPSLTQVRPCSQNTAQCPYEQHKHSYSLWAGPWSPCRRKGAMPSGRTMVDFSNNPSRHIVLKSPHTIMGNIHSQHHHHDHHRSLKASWEIHVGYQTRQVRCTKSDGKNALLSLCDHAGTPVNFRSCVMPRDCDVSAWSEWSPCSRTCRSTDQSPGFRSRKRSVRTVPIAGGEECPALEEVETCNTLEDLLPHCPRYDWKVTNWGSCQVKLLISQQDHRHGNSSFLCGGGIQTREAYCVRIFDNATKSHVCRPVGQNLCSNLPPPSLIQFCSIPCSKPCHLSPWSPWGPCIHDNTIEHPGTKGFKFRMRFIVEEPSGESESCPHVSEAMTCDHPVSFLWRVTSQGPCLPQDRACGRGVQEQTVECVTVTGDTFPIEQCPGDRPPVREPCQMPCPDDCVLGEWSSWSSCSHCCSGKQAQGKQARSRLILAPPGEQGKGCLPAPVLEQWRACGTQAYTVNYWDTSPWGPCTPDSGTDRNSTEQEETEEKACGTGIQTRRVACRRADGGGGVESNSCPESTRPDPWRSCVLPCKVDCIVTPFSKWSPCPTSCSPTNSSVSIQSRHRIIIQRPDNGGQECPATLYEERECDPRPLCPTYRWQTHRWHQCILVPDSVRQAAGSPSETCGLGLQTRAVTCVRADDAPADMAECVRWAGPMPDAVQQCGVACKDDCIFSSWSKFSQCDGCGGSRTRTRSLIGRSKKWWRCQQETLVEKEACPCSNYHIQGHGPWSPCILPELHQHAGYLLTKRGSHLVQGITRTWHIHGEGKECGHGWRYRALACLDHHERLVNPALCNSSGVEEEKCAVPCPLNCRLSEWSAWSSCSAPCGGGVKVRARWLREKPFNGGRPCPKLNIKNQAQVSEVVPCYSECNQYIWEAEPWSMCVVGITSPTRPSCGEGVQTRKIRCVRKEEDRRSGMNDTLCSRDDRPIAVQSCLVPCPGQCVTSEWSSWSECSMGCNEKELRWRSKTIVRMPGKGHTCPELNQTQTCANTSCLSYSYAYSDWSSCRLSDNAVCGQGTKTRLLNCVDSDGKLVELGMCKEWGPSRGKLSAPCEVSCPVDCLLSDWSLWSQCSHTCGVQSQMTRSRLVLHQAGEGGRPCPSQLSQTKPCPIRPCYSWTLGDWNSCKVEGAECGDGMRERNVSCVVHWGSLSAPPFPKAVPEEQCVENGLRKATEAERRHLCYVPCPGDCHLTDWSPWSVCQLLCLDGRSFETWGHQARSRAVSIQVPENKASCPSQVYETRPCQRGTCLSYEWVTGEWRENQRAVWCRRSDGVNVTGGCFAQTKPSGVHQCSPPCTKPFSYCTQSETCGCEKGFTEVMTSNGFLDYCTKSPGTDKKANVKRSGGRLRRTHQQNESRAWTLQPLGPDGRVRLWVYGLMAGGFIMILLIIAMSFLLCKNPKDDPNSCKTQRAVALAYDGDADM